MSDPYVGQIQATPYTFAPFYWAYCDGQTLLTSQYQALYSIIGNVFGGNTSNFNLPDLRGKAVMKSGQGAGLSNRPFGATVGQTQVDLSLSQIPIHNHAFITDATQAATSISPSGAYLAEGAIAGGGKGGGSVTAKNLYTTTAPTTALSPKSIRGTSVSIITGHNNKQPYLVIPFCIALMGEYPVFQ